MDLTEMGTGLCEKNCHAEPALMKTIQLLSIRCVEEQHWGQLVQIVPEKKTNLKEHQEN